MRIRARQAMASPNGSWQCPSPSIWLGLFASLLVMVGGAGTLPGTKRSAATRSGAPPPLGDRGCGGDPTGADRGPRHGDAPGRTCGPAQAAAVVVAWDDARGGGAGGTVQPGPGLRIAGDMTPHYEGKLENKQLAVGACDVQDLNVESDKTIAERLRFPLRQWAAKPTLPGVHHTV
jgi:hypothetical protein